MEYFNPLFNIINPSSAGHEEKKLQSDFSAAQTAHNVRKTWTLIRRQTVKMTSYQRCSDVVLTLWVGEIWPKLN